MFPEELNQAWVKQAQLDAERGVIECRICRERIGLDRALTLWRNGMLVFAVCDDCAAAHDILMRPVEKGIQIRAQARLPIVIRGAGE